MEDRGKNGHKKSIVVDNFGKDEHGNQVADPKPGFVDEGKGGFKGYRKPQETEEQVDKKLDTQEAVDKSIKEIGDLRETPGASQFLPHMDNRKDLRCACNNRAFEIIVVPDIKSGSGKILELYCLNPACRKGVIVSETGTVGGSATLTVDAEGKKHHRIIAETGRFLSKPG